MSFFLSEQRQARWQPRQFLDRFNLPAGTQVVDLGCGPGFWTLPLADIAGAKGMVWAVDVNRGMLDILQKRNPPEQVHLLESELCCSALESDSVDFVWAAFVLHEVPDLQQQLRELHRIGKRVGILEWRPDAIRTVGPPLNERLASERLITALRAEGFTAVKQTWQDDDAYLVEAEK